MRKLTLAMIVKDESATIERCLRSAMPFVDAIVIHDTGSKDDTVEVIQSTIDSDCILVVHETLWQDFSTNLNEVIHEAATTFEASDYVLRLDADMELLGDPRPHLDGETDAYDLTLREGSTYKLPLITRAGACVAYIGKTHEYVTGYESLGDCPVEVVHHGDGGSKADKHERDIKLLEGEKDPRSTFYRAQAYHCLGKYQKALREYVRRSEMVGYVEETFLAIHRAGECLQRLGMPRPAMEKFIAAFNYRPNRIEPLVRLAEMHRETKQQASALLYARTAYDMSLLPQTDRLFVEQWMYDWGAMFEYSLARWYFGEKDKARIMWTELLEKPLGDEHRKSVEKALKNF